MFRTFMRAVALAGLCASAAAQLPVSAGFSYQGHLKEGDAPADGAYDFIFELLDAATGDSVVGGQQLVPSVLVRDGLFTVEVNNGGEFGPDAFNGEQRWLRIHVKRTGGFVFEPLSPRQPLTAAPYALYALHALNAPDGHSLDAADGSPTDAVYVGNNGYVGIGTNAPGALLHVVQHSNTSAVIAIDSRSISREYAAIDLRDRGIPVWGLGKDPDFDFYVDQSGVGRRLTIDSETGNVGIGTSAPDVFLHLDQNSNTNGVIAVDSGSTSPQYSAIDLRDRGVAKWSLGKDPSNDFYVNHSGLGRSLTIDRETGNVGIGTTAPAATLEVYGTILAPQLAIGRPLEPGYVAHVFGEALIERSGVSFVDLDVDTDGQNRARLGWDGTSMYLEQLDSGLTGRKIEVRADGPGGPNTEFRVLDRTGAWQARVFVLPDNTFGHVGILEADFLTVPGKAFKIDHPLDPANKFLYHSCVESPDMKNIYDGVVTTDARGYATVRLPEYFEALNESFRYQLTVVDAQDDDEFVLAKVVREVEDNQFTLRTSAPGVRVSWQVTGIRHDAFARAMPITCEVSKEGLERGRYMHPRLFGQADEMGIKAIGKAAPARGD